LNNTKNIKINTLAKCKFKPKAMRAGIKEVRLKGLAYNLKLSVLQQPLA